MGDKAPFIPVAADGRDTSGAITSTIVSWVTKECGAKAVKQLLKQAGEKRPIQVLADETTWSGHQEVTDLLEAAIKVSGEPEAAYLIGVDMLSEVMGSEVGGLLRSLGSTGAVLRQIAESGAKFTTTLDMRASKVTDSSAVVSVHTINDIPRYLVDCDLTRGMLSIAPVLFGLDPAHIDETKCQAKGDTECLYKITWDPSTAAGADSDKSTRQAQAELADLNKRFRSLQQMATELVSAEDVESLLGLVTRRAGVAVRANKYLLAVHLDGRLRIHSDGFKPAEAQAVAMEVLSNDPDDHDGSRLMVDVTSGSHHYGRLAAIHPEGSRFFPQERDLLSVYAAHAAAVLNTAAALEESRRQNQTSAALLSLARTLAEASSPEIVANKVSWAVSQIVSCLTTCVFLWDKEGRSLVLSSGIGVPARIEKHLSEVGIGVTDTPQLARMLEFHEPILFNYETADDYQRSLMKPGENCIAIVPIVARGEFYGAISVTMSEPLASVRQDADLLHRLGGVASQAGTALENALLLEQVRHQALHDPLTGLPNRSLLNDRAGRALVEAVRSRDRVALAFLDLDRFKKVNDTLGHREGDDLLTQVAGRLSDSLRASDTVVRLGGDEFVVLIPHISEAPEAVAVAEKVLVALTPPFQVDSHEIFVTASVGVSVSPKSGGVFETLLKQADMAMYRAKSVGGGHVQLFEASPSEPRSDVLALEADLHSAIERGEMRVLYQPQIELTTSQIVGVEALVRWFHPRLGLLEPSVFLPLAEGSDVIIDIDLWVLKVALEQAAAWSKVVGHDLRMAVNLANRTAHSTRLEPAVKGCLENTGVPPAALELEITESVIDYGNDVLRQRVGDIRALGVQFAIDDFGTGSSSFGRINGIEVDSLKIDRSLIVDLLVNPQTAPLLSAMLNMGTALGLRVIAEGVEKRKQAVWLRENSCALAQGYLFARPSFPDVIDEMLYQQMAQRVDA